MTGGVGAAGPKPRLRDPSLRLPIALREGYKKQIAKRHRIRGALDVFWGIAPARFVHYTGIKGVIIS